MRWLQLINVNSYKLFCAKPQMPKITDLNKHLEYQYYIAPLGGDIDAHSSTYCKYIG